MFHAMWLGEVTIRHRQVYAHGAARGHVSSNQTDRDHYCGGNEDGKRASDWQVGNQAGGYTFSPERKGCSDSETSADHPQGVTNDYAYNVSPCRTERDAEADLMCAPRDRVRERAVQAVWLGMVAI